MARDAHVSELDSALAPGAHADAHGTTFVVLATKPSSVAVRLCDDRGRPVRTVPLDRQDAEHAGRFARRIDGVLEGALYDFVLDGEPTPDPYARFLPLGVHGPARVTSARRLAPLPEPPALHRWSVYELHVGTFSPEGTFRGALSRLDHLVDLGVTAIELLPIAAFDGARGWGYDGVALYAPHAPYGDPDDLRALVEGVHARGLAVIVDAVFNHLGPSGNYLARYAPEYFTSKVQTPWGDSPDFTWEPMRQLVLGSARRWLDDFGVDALRLDATHAVHDASPRHILREIADLAHTLGRTVFFEDERNEPDVLDGLAADAVWADDFHHQVHALVTGERDGYYAAYEPTVPALAANIERGWTYEGQPYAPWRGRPRGKPARGIARERLVTCIQNHDQVGNRALGQRLSALCSLDAYAAAAMLALFVPSTPVLFMGQEWAASTPFLYFTDHGGELGASVSRGRREEFASFSAFADPALRERIPDPEAASTFEASRLRWEERESADGARVLDLHRAMLRLRRTDPVLSQACRDDELTATETRDGVLEVTRRRGADERRLVVNFGAHDAPFTRPPDARVLLATGRRADATLPPHAALLLALGPG
ncbi:MAG: malto-oligosyltrehalose trehalohydrolase [Labilithrix sp.]|nr:malto-oligosyltrehalose trehalohydrolase [Labilithrix sp.]